MKQENNLIYGWRQPTARERDWIAACWGEEFNRTMHKKSGNMLRYFGIFLIVTGVASVTRGEGSIGGAVVTILLALGCLVAASANRKNYGRKDNVLSALDTGNYQVAPAQSVEIFYARNQSYRKGGAKVVLPNGQPLEGSYRIPYRCAEPYLKQKVHRVNLLLIRIPGEVNIYAIPVE